MFHWKILAQYCDNISVFSSIKLQCTILLPIEGVLNPHTAVLQLALWFVIPGCSQKPLTSPFRNLSQTSGSKTMLARLTFLLQLTASGLFVKFIVPFLQMDHNHLSRFYFSIMVTED